MRLPSVNKADVPQAKIVLYMLNPEHRAGKGKARFFSGHGFAPAQWRDMAEALRTHARENDVARQETTPLGIRFVVEGPMKMADGAVAGIRSVWFIEAGERTPRFVTAYPLKRSKQV